MTPEAIHHENQVLIPVYSLPSDSLVTSFYNVAKLEMAENVNFVKCDILYLPTALVEGQGGQHSQQWHKI